MVIPFWGNSIYDYPLQDEYVSEYKDKSKLVMVVTGPRTLVDYLAVQKTITGILDSRYCTCQMKRLERKAQQS
jgi:hypothetical protein